RTLDKALRMVKKIEEQGEFRYVSVNAYAFDDLPGQSFDIVINATSAGLSDSTLPLPPGIFAPGALAYDMMYGRETPFMAFARAHGAARVADGLGMLVEQAAEAFALWRGVRPETAPVIAQLRT
ncbi:MAG TPA: shikimate dehydrogenase, partial [Methylophilaceae bacterium]|nr:shikimate dehydrogenase [Methylophilaceae bacterium]